MNEVFSRITVRTVEDVISLIEIHGLATGGPGNLHDQIRSLLEAGKKKFVLNFSAVSGIDSLGLGHLLGSLSTVSNRQGILVLAALPGKVQQLLEKTRLLSVFVIFDSVQTALEVVKEWTFRDFLHEIRGGWGHRRE